MRNFFCWLITMGLVVLILLSFQPAITCGQDHKVKSAKFLLPDTGKIKREIQLGESYKPSSNLKNNDSALILFDNALKLSIEIHSRKWQNEAMLHIGHYYLMANDTSNGIPYFMQVIAYYRHLKDTAAEAGTWAIFADNFNRAPALIEKKIAYFRHAQLLYRSAHLPLKEIECSKNIADMHMVEGKYYLAEKEMLQVLYKLKSINYKKLHYTYDLLASVNRMKGNLHQELLYKLKVVSSMEATGDYKLATYFYRNLATTYFDLGLYDQSLVYYNKALPFSLKEENNNNFYELLRDIAKTMIADGKAAEALKFLQMKTATTPPLNDRQRDWMDAAFGNCYHMLNLNKKAEKYFLDMIRIANSIDKDKLVEDYLTNYSVVAQFYVATKQYQKANFYLRELNNVNPYVMRPASMSQIQLMYFQVDSGLGKWQPAIKHYQLYKKINDSLFNSTNKKLQEEVQLQYASEKKDQDLLLQSKNIQLLKKQSELEQDQVDRTSNLKNLFLLGIFILLAGLALLYNQYRFKQQSNLALEKKQKIITDKNIKLEKLLRDNDWLLKEVHHRVKNNMQIVMNLLTTQSHYLKDEMALNAVKDVRHRMQTMSLIHQKLYNSGNVALIYIPDYINELIRYFEDSFNVRKLIYFELDIAAISLDVTQALPVGLILNEAITNALKYAFPYSDHDCLTVRLNTSEDGKISMLIRDNGHGLPADMDVYEQDSFGIKLIKGMIDELGGNAIIDSHNGTSISFAFYII